MKIEFVIFYALFCFGIVYGRERCERDYVGGHMIDDKVKNKQICEKCMLKYNLTMKSMDLIENEKPDTAPREVQCYFACFFKNYGSMNETGDFVPEAVLTTLSQKNLDAAVGCIPPAMKYEDHCERSFQLYVCYIKGDLDT